MTCPWPPPCVHRTFWYFLCQIVVVFKLKSCTACEIFKQWHFYAPHFWKFMGHPRVWCHLWGVLRFGLLPTGLSNFGNLGTPTKVSLPHARDLRDRDFWIPRPKITTRIDFHVNWAILNFWWCHDHALAPPLYGWPTPRTLSES